MFTFEPALIQVKGLLPHGGYLPWVEANMPIKKSQCQKYVKLAKENPALLSNAHHAGYLDVDSELKLLSLDDDTSSEVRDFAKEHELTRNKIPGLTKKLKEASEQAHVMFEYKISTNQSKPHVTFIKLKVLLRSR